MSFAIAALGALAVVAGSIAAVAGFGIGSLLTPAVGVAIGTKAAVAVVSVPHLVATSVRLWHLRAYVDRDVLLSFGSASAVGGLLGAILHAALSSAALTIALGVLLILAGSLELSGVARRFTPGRTVSLAAGLASGAFGGLVGNQGGIRAAALLRFDLRPQAVVATATATALLVDLVRVPVYLATSATALVDQAGLVAALTAGVLVGTVVGTPVLQRMPESLFRRLLAIGLIALGAALILAPAG
jgi:uncharacterized membrane protein YfcA